MTQVPTIRHFEGREHYEVATDELFAGARHRIAVFDAQLSAGYNSQRRQEVLRHFLLAGRDHRIQILVHDASNIVRQCARLCQLLRQYPHAIQIHETPESERRVYDPFCIVDQVSYVRRFHFDDARGVTSMEDEATALALMGRFQDLWELSSPAIGATVLGL